MAQIAPTQTARDLDEGRVETPRAQSGKQPVEIEEKAEVEPRFQNAREIDAFEKLTPRLQEVLRLIAGGLSTKEIAAHLGISKKTVEFHRSRLTKQLDIHSIALLVRFAVRVGAIRP